jgi:hypothetical protein
MKPTEQEIQERAKQIGERPYHPIPDEMYRNESNNGISIRFELMRTAMGSVIGMDSESSLSLNDRVKMKARLCTNYTNALLLEMARQELGVGDE